MSEPNDAETVSETFQEEAETSQKQNVGTETETDDSLNTTLLNQAFRLRVTEGKSFREIAKKTGLSLATVGRVLKGVNPMKASTETDSPDADPNEGGEADSMSFTQLSPSPSSIPTNYFIRPGLTASEWSELSKLDKNKLLAKVIDLQSQNSSMQAQAVLGKGDGNATSHIGSESYFDGLSRLVEKVSMQRQADRIVDKMFPEEKKNDDVVRKLERLEDKLENRGKPESLEKAAEIVGNLILKAQGQSQSANPWEVAKSIIGLSREQAQLSKGSDNEYTLKHEEMKQVGKLEEQKLTWEMEKWREQKQSTTDTINAIKEIFQGPVGEVIKNIGAAGAERFRGDPRVPMQKAKCPNCSAQFSANPKLERVMCPSCGAILEHSQVPPTTPATEPSTEKQEEPEKEKEEAPAKQKFGYPEGDF